MGLIGLSRGRWTAIASGLTLVMAGSAALALALASPGYTAPALSLHDAGVWVTGTRRVIIGQVNPEIRQQVLAVPAVGSAAFDVLQDGTHVFARLDDKRVLRRIDVPGRRMAGSGPGAALPKDAEVSLGGGTLAVLDPSSGAVWVRPAADGADSAFAGAPPAAVLGPGAAITVDGEGTVHVAAPASGAMHSFRRSSTGVASVSTDDLPGLQGARDVAVTAVGTTPVVLKDGHAVLVPGRSVVELAAADEAVLQQPGGARAGEVLVATRTSLFAIPLAGDGAARSLAGSGTGEPAAPVFVGGCAYAVWAARPTLITRCGSASPTVSRVPATPGGGLRLRVNRGYVVLNDPQTGEAFLPDNPTVSIADWDDLGRSDDRQTDRPSTEQSTEQARVADRRAANRPPVAQDDAYGVRPGSTVLLPVLDNDLDPDGDVLLVTGTLGLPAAFGHVQPVANGRALQVTVAGSAGTRRFDYTVDDGRDGGSARAGVNLRIVPPAQNTAPRRTGDPVVTVGRGGTVRYDVLRDWRDAEGDPLTLRCPAPPIGLRCATDGTLTYRDDGQRLGRHSVRVEVNDGRAAASGTLTLDVVAERVPLTRPDHATGVAGIPLVVHPLDNDTGYGSDALRLGRVVASDPRATAVVGTDGSVRVTAPTAGTVYLSYQAVDGSLSSDGLIRVTVVSPTGGRPPAAAPDSAVVRPLIPVGVNVLANDTDLDGDVLVVTGAMIVGDAERDTLKVEVLGRRSLRLTATADFRGPTSVTYTVSDGPNVASATVLVRRVDESTADLPPSAVDDRARVRAGQVAAVAALENDSDPDGEPLTLDPELRDVSFRASGASTATPVIAFVSGDLVRVVAPDRPGTITATYTARDATGQPASAYVVVQVLPADAPDAPPAPAVVDVRAVAGRPTTVIVPLAGIDPDGDPVTLSAPVAQPRKGALTLDPSRFDAFVYTPRPDAFGADEVAYQVVDHLGATGRAVLRIGVAPPPVDAAPPVAVDDTVLVRSDRDRLVQVAVLANDTSPVGDPVEFAAPSPVRALTPAVSATVTGSVVQVQTRRGQGTDALVSYRVVAGGIPAQAPGLLSVTSRPDAPLLAPVARDDVAEGAGRSIDVPVLANDTDPDGPVAELAVAATPDAVGPPGVASRVDSRTIRVVPAANARWAWYTVIDAEGQTGRGLVLVPGTGGPPRLKSGAPPFEVAAGQTRTLALSDYVEAPGGRAVRLTEVARVSGSGVRVQVTSPTTIVVTGGADFGAGAVTFEVMAGTSVNDPSVHRAHLTVPVTVLSKGNRPPVLRPQVLTVAQGGSPALLDLEAATDDDPGDAGHHTYRIRSAPARGSGVTATVSGRTLSISATSAPAGSRLLLLIEVGDGRATGTGRVQVDVTSTRQPPPQVRNCNPPAGQAVEAGRRVTVDLARCTVNPFAGTASLAVTVSQVAGASVSVSGQTLTIDIAAGVVGRLEIPYSVRDAAGRTASALVILKVANRPSAPGQPELVGQPGNGSVTLRWMAADPQGGTISEYRVRDAGTGYLQSCPRDATQCTLTGLRNNVTYRFTVAAVNERGEGTASPPSVPVRPDVQPSPPSAVTAVGLDGAVRLTWTGDAGAGSPIESYTVTVTPPTADGRGELVVPSGSQAVRQAMTTTVTGLANGTSYTFAITAKNASLKGLSDPTTSPPVIPAGPAKAPPAPTVTETGGVLGGQVTVNWSPAAVKAAANGLLSRFTITETSGALPPFDATSVVDAGSRAFAVATDSTYHFALTVQNNTGSSATGPATQATAEGTPDKPRWAGGTVGDGQVALAFDNVVPNGVGVRSIDVTWEGGAQAVTPVRGQTSYSLTVAGLTNGRSYTFSVRVCNTSGRCTVSDPSAAYQPYGTPVAADVSATGNLLQITFSWGAANVNGDDTARSTVTISDGGGSGTCSATPAQAGTCTIAGIAGRTYTATYTITGRRGTSQKTSNPVTATAPAPPRSVSFTHGGRVSTPACSSASCAYVVVNLSGFAPNTTYSFHFTSQPGPFIAGGVDYGNVTVTTNGEGAVSRQTNAYFGWPGQWVGTDGNGVDGTQGRSTW